MNKQHKALTLAEMLIEAANTSDLGRPAIESDFRRQSAETIRRQHALIEQLAEWAESYMEAQGALDNRELLGTNAPSYWELQAKCHRNREAFEDTLISATSYLGEQA